jgi:hypothetical protein
MRRGYLEIYKLAYDEELRWAQDYDLWVKCAKSFPLSNLGEVLVLYRLHSHQIGNKSSDNQKKVADLVRKRQLQKIGLSPDSSELLIHSRLSYYDYESSRKFVEETEAWLLKMCDANRMMNYYPHYAFEQVLGERWYSVCTRSSGLGVWTWKKFWQSPLNGMIELSLPQKIKFGMKCGMRYGAANV